MTEEEYFIKNYPVFCYGDRPLSPYWDLFQDGVEFGERQSEKKTEELELKLKEIEESDSVTELKLLRNTSKSAERDVRNAYKNGKLEGKAQLTKAKEIIRTFLNMPMPNNEEVFADVGAILTEAEQFLKEIEKC